MTMPGPKSDPRRRGVPAAILLLALAGAPVGAGAAPAGRSAAPVRIAMTVNSWGAVLADWSVDAQGQGVYRDGQTSSGPPSEPPAGPPSGPLPARPIAAGADGSSAIRATLQPAESLAGKAFAAHCRREMTDQPYGTVSWTYSDGRTAVLTFTANCMDPGPKAVLDRLRAAWDQAKAYAGVGAPAGEAGAAAPSPPQPPQPQ